jgi:glucose-1-phosphate thymidylyltransferase
MKGIILAGGSGTRLYPVTSVISKQLLPVYDKPMIYYPLSVLMFAGIREILIISTPVDIDKFKTLFGDGSQLGLSFSYAVQDKPRGLADAFVVGEKFIGNDSVCLILGDNIFYGNGMQELLKNAVSNLSGATIFGYYVKSPERYGVVEFDKECRVISIEEKPKVPKSKYAVVGLYFYENDVVERAKNLKPSKRGEIEITDLNNIYLKENKLKVEFMTRGFAWLDTGTHASMIDAINFVKTIEDRQGLKIACIEEVALRMGFIDKNQFKRLAEGLSKSSYGEYMLEVYSQL